MSHTFHAHWSEEDQEFVGTCDQYPSLSWLATTETKALKGITRLVTQIDTDLDAGA